MIRLIIFFAVITLLSLLLSWLLEVDGLLTVDWLGYHIESSLVFSIALAIGSLLLISLVIRFICWLKNTPHRLVNGYRERKKRQAIEALMEGFSAVAVEDVAKARKLAAKADPALPVTMLLQAQAAYAGEDAPATKKYLSDMLAYKETELIGIKGLMQQAQKEEKWTEALTLAEKACYLKPEAKWANLALLSLYKQMERWKEAQAAAENAFRHHALAKEEFLHEKAVLSYMQSKENAAIGHIAEATKHARTAHLLLPSFVPASLLYAELLLQQGKKRAAVNAVEEGWNYTPHADLAALILRIYDNEPNTKKVKRLSALGMLNPSHPESHSAVAGFLINLGALDRAREHLRIALSKGDTVMLCKLMVKLELKEQRDLDLAEEWLERALIAPLGTVYLCNHCGSYSINWEAHCNTCGTFDSFRLPRPSQRITSPSAKERDLLAYAASGTPV